MTYAHRLAARHLIYTAIELIREIENDSAFVETVHDTFNAVDAQLTLDNLGKANAELAEVYHRFSKV